MKCASPNIKDEDWTFLKIETDFIEKFIPTDHASKARYSLAHMQMEGEPFHGDFHKFKSEFELEAARSGITDKHILMDIWLYKAGQFYDAAIRMRKLRGGTNYIPASTGPRKNSRNPMAMDVDWIYLTLAQ